MSTLRRGLCLLCGLLATACVDGGIIGRADLPDGGDVATQGQAAAGAGDGDATGDGDGDDTGQAGDGEDCQDDPACIPCTTDDACPVAMPLCDELRCVACEEDLQCPDDQSCEDGACITETADDSGA